MNKWSYFKLEQVCRVIPGGTPKTEIKEYWNEHIPWITPKDLSGYTSRYISKGARSISKKGLANSSASLCPPGSVLLSTRAPIGYIAISTSNVSTNQGMKALVPKMGTTTNFLYYLVKHNIPLMIHLASGSTFKEISTNNIRNLVVKVPSLNQQKAIANILSSLDDKIELNNKMNSNLEDLAQILYKRWFVDFEFPNEDGEPYKSSGGEMVESESGLIPRGWRVIEFGDIFDFIKGKKPLQLSNVNEKGYQPYLTIANIENNERNYADTNGTVLVSKYETIMVMDGGSSGKVHYGLSGILGSTMSVLKSINNDINMFILLSAKFNEIEIREKTTGSAIPHTDKEFVRKIKLSVNDTCTKLFDKIVRPMFDKIISSRIEIQNLVRIRDELLPKLMNGEIEVPIEE